MPQRKINHSVGSVVSEIMNEIPLDVYPVEKQTLDEYYDNDDMVYEEYD